MKFVLTVATVIFAIYAVRLGELYTQAGRYQTYWNRQNHLPAQANEILYVALGDSTAVGIGANKPQNGYVGYIARELEEKTGRSVRILNFGETSAKVSDAVNSQLPKLKSANISSDSVITIEIGANDMKNFEDVKFEREMNELMSRLPKQTVISNIPYFGAGINRGSEPNVKKANKIIDRLAEKHGLNLADLYARTRDNSGFKTFAVDWFHPSAYGYRSNWVPAFLESIDVGKEPARGKF
ncbi:SGNH/GDSL hydrolase family protein [Candidatus Parcubacteria bacterium]|nr:SGNH/GDSL hydrolase family protein [Candidatus Parcubacteria bacterium]